MHRTEQRELDDGKHINITEYPAGIYRTISTQQNTNQKIICCVARQRPAVCCTKIICALWCGGFCSFMVARFTAKIACRSRLVSRLRPRHTKRVRCCWLGRYMVRLCRSTATTTMCKVRPQAQPLFSGIGCAQRQACTYLPTYTF